MSRQLVIPAPVYICGECDVCGAKRGAEHRDTCALTRIIEADVYARSFERAVCSAIEARDFKRAEFWERSLEKRRAEILSLYNSQRRSA